MVRASAKACEEDAAGCAPTGKAREEDAASVRTSIHYQQTVTGWSVGPFPRLDGGGGGKCTRVAR